MRDDVVSRIVIGNEIMQDLAIIIINFEAVLLEKRNHVVFKIDQAIGEYVLHDRFTDLELAQSIEVNFVDGATRRDKANSHSRISPIWPM